jgi:hypothetical protein
MRIRKFYYHNLGYWFLAFIGLSFAAFYTTYFIRIFEPTPAIIHIHFALMVFWLGMLILQPFLIKYKKLHLHRLLGRASYVLVPLVLITGFLLARNEYYRKVDRFSGEVLSGLKNYTDEDILQLAAKDPIAIFYIAWFMVFYFLAIKNKHKSAKHARYMLATGLTLTGPTVDRILGIHFGLESIAGISSYVVSFVLIDILLGLLLYLDIKNKRDTYALRTCLIIYIFGQLCYFILPDFDIWYIFMKYLMLPET